MTPYTAKTQTEIVTYIKGSPTNNTYGSVWETANAVDYVTGGQYNAITSYPFPFTFDKLKTSLGRTRPVISLVNENGSGHYYVVSGYNNATESLFVINPGDAVRYTVNYYDFHYGDTTDGWRDSRPRVGDVVFRDWEA